MQQKVYETRMVMFLSTWNASLGPDKDESVICKCEEIHVSQTLISPFKLDPSCKHPSVFSLVLNSYSSIARHPRLCADKHLIQQKNHGQSNKAWKLQSTSYHQLPQYTENLSPFINIVGVFH